MKVGGMVIDIYHSLGSYHLFWSVQHPSMMLANLKFTLGLWSSHSSVHLHSALKLVSAHRGQNATLRCCVVCCGLQTAVAKLFTIPWGSRKFVI